MEAWSWAAGGCHGERKAAENQKWSWVAGVEVVTERERRQKWSWAAGVEALTKRERWQKWELGKWEM